MSGHSLTDGQLESVVGLINRANELLPGKIVTIDENTVRTIKDGTFLIPRTAFLTFQVAENIVLRETDGDDEQTLRDMIADIYRDMYVPTISQTLLDRNTAQGSELFSLERDVLRLEIANALVKEYNLLYDYLEATDGDLSEATDLAKQAVLNQYNFTDAGFVKNIIILNGGVVIDTSLDIGGVELIHHCFPAGTKIRLADGTEKAIEHISTNDKVASFHPEHFAGRGGHYAPHAGGLVAAMADVGLVAITNSWNSGSPILPFIVIPAFAPESSSLSSNERMVLLLRKNIKLWHYWIVGQHTSVQARNDRKGVCGLFAPHPRELVSSAVNDNENKFEYMRAA